MQRLDVIRRWTAAAIGLIAALAAAALAAATNPQTVLVLGDSISAAYGIDKSAGWVQLLDDRLAQNCSGFAVVNASVSGETTAGGLARLPDLLARLNPAVVVVELGANDGLRGLPARHIAGNLRQLVGAVRSAGAQPVLLGMRIPPNFGAEYNRQFEKAFREVAAAEGVPWVPFFLDGVGGRPELFQADGLHPGVDAQARLLENAWAVLQPLLGARCGVPPA